MEPLCPTGKSRTHVLMGKAQIHGECQIRDTLVSTNSLNCKGGKTELKTPRLCKQRSRRRFLVLCKWIETRHVDKSSPDEPRLAELWLLSTQCEGDKAERSLQWKDAAPLSPLLGPGPPKTAAEQMSTFNKATRHKKHREECPLRFTQPAAQLYIKKDRNW